MLLLVTLMLNMVLAIVLDLYTDMRRRSGQSETVGATLVKIWQRILYCRQWISFDELNKGVSSMDRFFMRSDMQTAFPNMCDAQLHMLVGNCHKQTGTEISEQTHWTDSMSMMMAVQFSLDKMSEGIHQLQTGIFDTKDVCSQLRFHVSNENRGWLQEIAERMAIQNHGLLTLQWRLRRLQWQ